MKMVKLFKNATSLLDIASLRPQKAGAACFARVTAWVL